MLKCISLYEMWCINTRSMCISPWDTIFFTFHRENTRSMLSLWRTLLTNLPCPGMPPLLPRLCPPPPLMWPNPSLTPLLHPRRQLHLQGCVPAAVSHPATTPRPCGRTRQTLWHPHRARRQRRPAPRHSALLLHTSLRGWRGAVTEGRDSHLRTTHNP